MDDKPFLLPEKDSYMEMFLKITGIVLAVAGAVIVFAAKRMAISRNMAENQVVNLDAGEEAMNELRLQKAVVKVKIIGGIVFLPGMLIILYAFR